MSYSTQIQDLHRHYNKCLEELLVKLNNELKIIDSGGEPDSSAWTSISTTWNKTGKSRGRLRRAITLDRMTNP